MSDEANVESLALLFVDLVSKAEALAWESTSVHKDETTPATRERAEGQEAHGQAPAAHEAFEALVQLCQCSDPPDTKQISKRLPRDFRPIVPGPELVDLLTGLCRHLELSTSWDSTLSKCSKLAQSLYYGIKITEGGSIADYAPTMLRRATLTHRIETFRNLWQAPGGGALPPDALRESLRNFWESLDAPDVYLLLGFSPTAGTPSAFPPLLPPRLDTLARLYLSPHSSKPMAANALTVGARALHKHSVRSRWYGHVSGSAATMNLHAVVMFVKVMKSAVWFNVFALPHDILVFEMRCPDGHGLRWEASRSSLDPDTSGLGQSALPCETTGERHEAGDEATWRFRGFVEPMTQGGHDNNWRANDAPLPSLGGQES